MEYDADAAVDYFFNDANDQCTRADVQEYLTNVCNITFDPSELAMGNLTQQLREGVFCPAGAYGSIFVISLVINALVLTFLLLHYLLAFSVVRQVKREKRAQEQQHDLSAPIKTKSIVRSNKNTQTGEELSRR